MEGSEAFELQSKAADGTVKTSFYKKILIYLKIVFLRKIPDISGYINCERCLRCAWDKIVLNKIIYYSTTHMSIA